MTTKTIGQEIQELVEKYGNSTIGFFIVAESLREMCDAEGHATVHVGRKLYHQTEGYRKVYEVELGKALDTMNKMREVEST